MIAALFSFFVSNRIARSAVIIAGIAGALLVGAWRIAANARRAERLERATQDMRDHVETRRRMDDATEDAPDSVAAAREWLRDRANRGDGDL